MGLFLLCHCDFCVITVFIIIIVLEDFSQWSTKFLFICTVAEDCQNNVEIKQIFVEELSRGTGFTDFSKKIYFFA